MIVIGLTGSIAMGKSEVAKILRAEQIPVFDADNEVHALYDSGEGVDLVRPIAPEAIADGKVSRQILSRVVVANPQLLGKLERRVHAAIALRRVAFINQAEAEGRSIVVIDVPLLLENGGDKDVDTTIVVSAPRIIQRQRALARTSMTADKLAMIEKRQMPDSEKRRRADYIIENDGTLDDLRDRTRVVLNRIKKDHAL